MLRACYEVLKQGGRLGFHVIHTADGLSSDDHRKAVELGPEHVEAKAPYGELLKGAGFETVEMTDVTDDYRRILGARMEHSEPFTDELRSIYGAEVFDERRAVRARAIEAADAGLLKRAFVIASRPVPGTVG